MNEQELFSERMNGLLDLAMDKGGMLSKGEIHFYLKDVLQSEDQYEFVYQFFSEKGVRVEGWHGGQRGETKQSAAAKQKEKSEQTGETKQNGKSASGTSVNGGYADIEDFTGLMGGHDSENPWETYENNLEDEEAGAGTDAEEVSREQDLESDAKTAESAAGDEEDDEDEEDSFTDTESLSLPSGIDESLITEDEKRYLKYYQADLEKVEPVTEAERNSLLNALAAGDPSVMNRLVEGHLYLVMEEIAAYLHAGVSVGDLIQEASIGLIEGIQSYRGMNFESHVRYAIREALDAITEEQQASDSVAKHLLDSINRADEATRKLSEDLDRAPTKEELAEYLHMDVDEVETLLKHSIDALTVSVSDEAYGKTDEGED